MTHETDLPCSECGEELIERSIVVDDVAYLVDVGTHVTVAECRACGARYYPRETLARLAADSNGSRPRGDS